MPIFKDLYKCKLLIKKDIIHAYKDLRSKVKMDYLIHEDFYIFFKILRLLQSIKHKDNDLTEYKMEVIRISIKELSTKEMVDSIYNVLI